MASTALFLVSSLLFFTLISMAFSIVLVLIAGATKTDFCSSCLVETAEIGGVGALEALFPMVMGNSMRTIELVSFADCSC